MVDINTLKAELVRDEGKRNVSYLDSEGIATIGIGRNIETRGLSEEEIQFLFENDVKIAIEDVEALVPNFASLTDARQRALVNMAFNLGRTRLAQFKKMLAAIEAQDYASAAEEMLDSRWAIQVGQRAERLAQMMRQG